MKHINNRYLEKHYLNHPVLYMLTFVQNVDHENIIHIYNDAIVVSFQFSLKFEIEKPHVDSI